MRIPNIDFEITHIEESVVILNDVNTVSSIFEFSKIIEINEVSTPTTHRRPKIKTINVTAKQISISISAYSG